MSDFRTEVVDALASFDRLAWQDEYDAADGAGRLAMLRRWLRVLSDAGLLGLSWPERFGGRGLGVLEEEVLADVMSQIAAPPLISTVGVYLAGPAIIAHGTEDQQQRYLPAILSGDELWCQGYSEADAGSDLGALQCRARPIEGGGFRVDGSKIWTSFAHVADRCFLLARTGPSDARAADAVTCLIVDMHDPRVTVTPIEDLLGRTEFNEVRFDGVEVPAEDVVGPVDGGWAVAMDLLEHERRMPSRGWAPRLETVVHDLVEMAAARELDDAQWDSLGDALVAERLHAAFRVTMVDDIVAGRYAGADASVEKLAWDAALTSAADAVRDLRGTSNVLLRDAESRRWSELVLDAPSHSIAGGTTEMQLNSVAHRVLGLPREPRRA